MDLLSLSFDLKDHATADAPMDAGIDSLEFNEIDGDWFSENSSPHGDSSYDGSSYSVSAAAAGESTSPYDSEMFSPHPEQTPEVNGLLGNNLRAAISRCKVGKYNHKFTMEDAFVILEAGLRYQLGRSPPDEAKLLESFRSQPTASPIKVANPDYSFLVHKMSPVDVSESDLSVPVKYQGFHNGEVWWSPPHFKRGVIARRMGKRPAKRNGEQQDSQSDVSPNITGKLYSLIETSDECPKNITPAEVRAMVITNAPALVKFWNQQIASSSQPRIVKRQGRKRARASENQTKTVKSESKLSDETLNIPTCTSEQLLRRSQTHVSQSLTPAASSIHPVPAMLHPKPGGGYELRLDGDLHVSGNIVARGNAHINGELSVSSGIAGQLVTPPEAADYAEWFYKLNQDEEILAGHVVQLRSPEQRVTLDTSGDGPWMVVSTKPSVAAGVPRDPDEAKKGVLCAFIGQVPVRVRGSVRIGDPLMPSGLNDGFAVAMVKRIGDPKLSSFRDPVGTSMEDAPTQSHVIDAKMHGKQIPNEHTVLSLVRWQHNLKWHVTKELNNAIAAIWSLAQLFVPAALFNFVIQLCIIQSSIGVFLSIMVLPLLFNAFRHYPVYETFAKRDFVLFYVLGIVETIHSISLAVSLVVKRGVEEKDFWHWSVQELCTLLAASLILLAWGLFTARSRSLMASQQRFVQTVCISDETAVLEKKAKSNKLHTE